MANFCMHCGSAVKPKDNYCMYCGKPVDRMPSDQDGSGGSPQVGQVVGASASVSPSGMPLGDQAQSSGYFDTPPHPQAVSGAPGSQPVQPVRKETLDQTSEQAGLPSWTLPANPAIDAENEADVALTEVWQVEVSKNPSHAAPFTMEVPRDEMRNKRPITMFGQEGNQIVADDAARVPVPDAGATSQIALPNDLPDSLSVAEAGPAAEAASMAEAGQGTGEVSAVEAVPAAKPVVEAAPADEALSSGGWARVGLDSDGDLEADSPTIVVQLLDDEEEESPTAVVIRERCELARNDGPERIEFIAPCIVGRGKASDKRFTGNQAISRKHAKFFKQDGRYHVEDLQSTNGTYVNGTAVRPGECMPVSDGDTIRLGTEDFTFSVIQA